MKRIYVSGIFGAILLVFALAIVSCSEESEETTEKNVEIKVGVDDGGVSVFTHYLPDTLFGFINGSSEGSFCGTVVSGGGDTLTTRVYYRFDISEWDGGDIVFHGQCIEKFGSPTAIEVYVIDGFTQFPDTAQGPLDVSGYWNLIQNGVKVGAVMPNSGDWFAVTVPDSVVLQKKTASNYLAFLLKLEDESSATDVYTVSTYEYAEGHNSPKPYLSWE